MPANETDILKLIANPNTQRKGFELAVERYAESLYRQIRRIVLTHDDANDVLQNTFIKAWLGLNSFQGRSRLSSWLYRIAINEALDFKRRKQEELSLTSNEGNESPVVKRLIADEYFDGDHTSALLQEAIHQLPSVQRTVFQLKYFENKKYSEISEILGTTEGALKASYHIAVNKITEFFKKTD